MADFIDTSFIDGYAGGPHITEKQVGSANQGIVGAGDYVLEVGQCAKAQVLTNNSVRIFDAVYSIQGRRDAIDANDYSDVTIANGTQGMNRNDIIVRRYRKDEKTEIETVEYGVKKGTPASKATDPEVTTGDIRKGDLLHEMKLYRVKIEGLNIVAVEQLFEILPPINQLYKYLQKKLSQEDTLKLQQSEFKTAEVQIRVRMKSGDALASDIMRLHVGRILKEGVI